ncbi:hypothetical protein PVK06_043342 [Gossypium arboreum]|uniref:Uncharacterized protein n=1 Tax=Gossypium arboreum TaxID=29729 RepID=A0ABR0MNG4_GOSAR|nr:hypothetical protein PVK06_043342 [Gossypium arboreum]
MFQVWLLWTHHRELSGCYKFFKDKEKEETSEQTSASSVVARDGEYGPWMLVELMSRRGTLDGIKKGNNSKGEKNSGSRFQSVTGLEANLTDEDLSKVSHRDLKKKGKVTSDSQEKISTGKKPGFNGSKKANVGLLVGKLLIGQAYDPKIHNFQKDHNQVGPKTGLVPHTHSAASQQASLDFQQTSSSFDFRQQKAAQASNEAVTVFSKTASATHVSCHNIGENNQPLNSDISESSCPLISNSQFGGDAEHVKVDTSSSVQKQAQHVVHSNPTFEKSSFVNVEVKGGVLEAKNHSAVVFKRSSILEPISEEIEDSVCPFEIKFPREDLKRQITNAKVTSSKEGWKLNKIRKGPGNRFKNSENTHVHFVDSMKRVTELIASEIDGDSANDFSRKKGEREEFSSTGHH